LGKKIIEFVTLRGEENQRGGGIKSDSILYTSGKNEINDKKG